MALSAVLLCASLVPASAAERALPYGREDFCHATNRAWMEQHPIPEAMPYNSEYVESTLALVGEIRAIVDAARDEATPSPAQRAIGDFYASYTNLARREERGLASLALDLHAIDSIRGRGDLARWFAQAGREHRDPIGGSRSPVPVPFHFSTVWLDPQDTRRAVPYLGASGLGLPDASYYRSGEARIQRIRESYLAHVANILRLAGSGDSDTEARQVLAVETQLAQALSAAMQEPASPGLYTAKELAKLAPQFDWKTFFKAAQMPAGQAVQVPSPAYLAKATALFAHLPHSERTTYLRWQLLRHYAPYLGHDLSEAAIAFYAKTLNGVQNPPAPEQAAAELIAYVLPEEVSSEYVRRFASPAIRAQAMKIAEDVRQAFAERVRAADWLEEATRSEAVKKLDALALYIGHSDEKAGRQAIVLDPDDLIGNLERSSERDYKRNLRRLRDSVPTSQWLASPASISGAYSQTANALVVAAGRIRPPLFDPAAADASNYGGLGTLVGHEIGHALDTIGSDYDAQGRLRNWWSEADRAIFQRKTKQLAEQYARYEPLPGLRVDGDRTLAENVADLTGLVLGYEALRRARRAQGAGLTHADRQAFFEGWARRWRVAYTEPLLAQVLQRDTHAPLPLRCIVPLSNFTPFYDFGGIGEGDADFRPMEQRAGLW